MAMDPSYVPALIGLAGVLVGSVISTGANLVIAVRREAVEKKLISKNNLMELRKAARFISYTIFEFQGTIEFCLNEKTAWKSEYTPDFDSWSTYRPIIAPWLTYEQWLDVQSAFSAINDAAGRLNKGLRLAEVIELDRKDLAHVVAECQNGIMALRPYTNERSSIREEDSYRSRRRAT